MSNIWGSIIGGIIVSAIGWVLAAVNWYSHVLVAPAAVDSLGVSTDAVWGTHGSQVGMYFGIGIAGVGEAMTFVALIALAVAWGIRTASITWA